MAKRTRRPRRKAEPLVVWNRVVAQAAQSEIAGRATSIFLPKYNVWMMAAKSCAVWARGTRMGITGSVYALNDEFGSLMLREWFPPQVGRDLMDGSAAEVVFFAPGKARFRYIGVMGDSFWATCPTPPAPAAPIQYPIVFRRYSSTGEFFNLTMSRREE